MSFIISHKLWNAGATYEKQIFFYPFWAIWPKKIKIVYLKWNLESRLIWICWIWWWCSFVLLWTENILLGKFGPKNQNCPFKMKVDMKTNLNMLNSIVMFICPVVNEKYHFWATFLYKISTFSFKIKVDT